MGLISVRVLGLRGGRDHEFGRIFLDDDHFSCQPSDSKVLRTILARPVHDGDEEVTAESDPKRFLALLERNYRGAYLRVSSPEGGALFAGRRSSEADWEPYTPKSGKKAGQAMQKSRLTGAVREEALETVASDAYKPAMNEPRIMPGEGYESWKRRRDEYIEHNHKLHYEKMQQLRDRYTSELAEDVRSRLVATGKKVLAKKVYAGWDTVAIKGKASQEDWDTVNALSREIFVADGRYDRFRAEAATLSAILPRPGRTTPAKGTPEREALEAEAPMSYALGRELHTARAEDAFEGDDPANRIAGEAHLRSLMGEDGTAQKSVAYARVREEVLKEFATQGLDAWRQQFVVNDIFNNPSGDPQDTASARVARLKEELRLLALHTETRKRICDVSNDVYTIPDLSGVLTNEDADAIVEAARVASETERTKREEEHRRWLESGAGERVASCTARLATLKEKVARVVEVFPDTWIDSTVFDMIERDLALVSSGKLDAEEKTHLRTTRLEEILGSISRNLDREEADVADETVLADRMRLIAARADSYPSERGEITVYDNGKRPKARRIQATVYPSLRLAIQDDHKITHVPTGLVVGNGRSAIVARALLVSIAGLDWNFYEASAVPHDTRRRVNDINRLLQDGNLPSSTS